MVNSRLTNDPYADDVRPGSPGRAPGALGRLPERGPAVGPTRPRIPTAAQLARLLINGILTLPRSYRRGMFLDIWV